MNTTLCLQYLSERKKKRKKEREKAQNEPGQLFIFPKENRKICKTEKIHCNPNDVRDEGTLIFFVVVVTFFPSK